MFIEDENEINGENTEVSNNPFEEKAENEPAEEDNKEDVSNDDDECEKLKAELADLNNKYIRMAADFDNYRKRQAQERESLLKYGAAETMTKLLAVLDTFERAKESLKDIDDAKSVKESYEVAYKQLLDTLKKIGLEEIEAEGKIFNPNEHEAITQVPSDELEPDTIAFVAQKGYKIQDRIIRPALVGVAVKKENE